MTHLITLEDGRSFPCHSEEFILDAAERAGVALPFSCRSGSCSTCVGRLLAGQVNQDDQTILDDAQIAQGYALLCVSLPLTPCLIRPDVQAELET